MTLGQVKRSVGVIAVLISIVLIYLFVLSQAWFGVVLGLFFGACGIQAVLNPDKVFHSRKETQSDPSQPRWKNNEP